MIIANPLYDTVFKGLATDLDIAKAIVSTLLETEVLAIQLGPTEHNKPLEDDDIRPTYMRLDYSAVIRDTDGTEKKILIEMQKAHGTEALMRFRDYIAHAGYATRGGEKNTLPIVTIYFLGFKLDSVDTPCLKVKRQYIDMLNDRVLYTKDKFVELLTHDAFIIQAPRVKIDGAPKTRLEEILSVFTQDNFADPNEETIYYNYQVEDEGVKKMLNTLQYYASDPAKRKRMDEETYWMKVEERRFGELIRKEVEAQARAAKAEAALADKEAALADQAAALADQAAALADQAAVIADKDAALAAKEAALADKDALIARLMAKTGENAQ